MLSTLKTKCTFLVHTKMLSIINRIPLSIRNFKLKDDLCVSEKHGMSISSHVFRNRERHKITHCYFFSLAMNILCLFLLSRLNKHEIIGSFILHQCTFYRNSYIEYFPTSQYPSSAHASYFIQCDALKGWPNRMLYLQNLLIIQLMLFLLLTTYISNDSCHNPICCMLIDFWDGQG